MIVTEFVQIKVGTKNKKYYENKQYPNVILRNLITVKVDDLQPRSNAIVEILCDYCKENTFSLEYGKYIRNKEKQKVCIDKDCCKECYPIKMSEVVAINGIATRKYFYEDMIEIFKANNLKALILKEKYIDINTIVDFICLKHDDKGVQHTT
jgi:hypothetical protein